ncbi:hypothetical protein [Methylomonas sp. AM2-LC]|uniref:hypothetical protein n=1 Tax=Methylomonas sp. AM2-LC TaxID=3153301 RepID=UPI0032639BCF
MSQFFNHYLIDDAAEMLVSEGLKFSDTEAGYTVIEMAKAYAKMEQAKIDAPRMPINEFVSRKEDMSPDGLLRLFRQEDGDICVVIVTQSGEMVSVEFCVPGIGGGRSGHTLNALNNLALAMMEDNKEFPGRNGERR